MIRLKTFFLSIYNRFVNDIALISFVILIQSVAAAIWPESGIAFDFAEMFFTVALVKSFSLGILSSLLSFNKAWIKWLFVMINIFIFLFYSYLALQFDVRFSSNVFALILQTNTTEASEFFQSYFPISTILILVAIFIITTVLYVILLLASNCIKNKLIGVSKTTKFLSAAIIIILTLISLFLNIQTTDKLKIYNLRVPIHRVFYESTLPYQDLITNYNAVKGNEQKIIKIKHANDIIQLDTCLFSCKNVVFVIGESYNKSHAGIYGYKHSTTPFMEREKQKGNLFAFSDVVSHSAGTYHCMQYFYSTKSLNDDKIWEDSPLLPAIFKKAGYNVTLLDNQNTRYSGNYTFDYTASFFINNKDIHEQCFNYRNGRVYRYDLDMIEAEKNVIFKNKYNCTFTIIHLNGQHIGASNRYPNISKYNYFTDDSIHRKDIKNQAMRWQIAYYDNATRYNDNVLNEIFSLYKDKEAVVLYVADHGDNMFDDSTLSFGRAIGSNKTLDIIKIFYEIPMIIWCSDEYISKHPDVMERIKSSVDSPFMHDDVCHILFDVAGIYGSFYDSSRSVINNDYICRKRIINGTFDYDANKKAIQNIVLRTKDN